MTAELFDRRPQWRREVLRTTRLGHPTKLLLLVLHEYMRADGKVSVSRGTIASELGWRHKRRVTYHLASARDAGFLITVNEGAYGRSATWQAVFPGDVRWRKTSHLIDDEKSPPYDPSKVATRSPPITKADPSRQAQTATFAVTRRTSSRRSVSTGHLRVAA